MSQYLSLNFMDILNFYTWYLYTFNDLIIYLELMIALNTVYMMGVSFFSKMWVQPLGDWLALEMFWTVLPMLVLVFLGFPSLKMLYLSELFNFSSKLSLKVTGHQWYWEYNFMEFMLSMMSYPKLLNDFIRLGESNLVCLPIHMKIRILMTSQDVIHSWAMPSLGFKMDACPGRLNFFMVMLTTPSKNIGQCSELCGAYHSWMPIYLEITSVSLFMEWMKILVK